MFLSTNSLSIVYTFSWEYISIFPLISWFVLYLILQALTNQNATPQKEYTNENFDFTPKIAVFYFSSWIFYVQNGYH